MRFFDHLRNFFSGTHIPVKLLREIKNEAHLFTVRWNNRINPLSLAKKKQLERRTMNKLHFGCGKRIIPGWINIDGYHAKGIDHVTDLRCPLPLSDNSTSLIFTEHVLEHLDYERDIPLVLSEFYRVLIPGGGVRIIVPDLEKYCKAYVSLDHAWFSATKTGLTPHSRVVNDIFMGHFHKFIYDFETLKSCLEAAGFQGITKTEYGSSTIDGLNLDTDAATRRNESLCVDAVKPA